MGRVQRVANHGVAGGAQLGGMVPLANGGVKGALRRPPDTPRAICKCCPLTGCGVVHGMDSKALHMLDDPFQDKGGYALVNWYRDIRGIRKRNTGTQ